MNSEAEEQLQQETPWAQELAEEWAWWRDAESDFEQLQSMTNAELLQEKRSHENKSLHDLTHREAEHAVRVEQVLRERRGDPRPVFYGIFL